MVQVEDLGPEEPYKPEVSTLLSKYQIPVHHLDFDYVETCNDGKELEQILQILRSGEEGYFPHLVEATEKRLAVIKPNSKFLRKICPVLKSSEIANTEWEGLSRDLAEWVEDVNKKDQELEDRKVPANADLTDSKIRKTQNMVVTLPVKTDRIKSTDYESWNKYDPDTEMLKMDLEDEKLKKEVLKQQKEKSKKPKMVRFNSFATEAEAIFEANREKERGNECFKAGEFSTALQHYTNSLECKPLAVVYSNRALIHNKLKQHQRAIDDCKLALKLEPKNFKAHLRLAQSYDALEQYDAALNSVEAAIEVDPNNGAAQQLANRARKKLGVTCVNKRFNIQDVDSNQLPDKVQTPKPILKSTKKTNEPTNSDTKPKSPKAFNESTMKPLKPIIRSSEPKKQKGTKSPNMGFEVISIPGSSKMPPPYYKVVHSNNPEIIKREKQKIFARPRLLHITIVDAPSDDDDIVNRRDEDEYKRPYVKVLPIKSSKRSTYTQVEKNLENCELEKVEDNRMTNKNTCTRKPTPQINNQPPQPASNTGAGGEPCAVNENHFMPTAEELQSPYTFIETWNSIRKDTSYRPHADILRKLDLGRIHQVIGYKLDDTMLSNIISCLHKHFMVPGELDRLHAILTNITQIPRFKMTLMFLDEFDRHCINQLLQFLDQHGRNLPTEIRNTYTN